MVIIYSPKFTASLGRILDFISLDSKAMANEFAKKLKAHIKSLKFMPYRCRKNAILGDENVRDLVFKGYVITYRINEKSIEVLLIYKENLPQF